MIFFILLFSFVPNDASIDDFLNDSSLLAFEDSMPYVVSIEKTILRKSTKNNQCTGMLVSSSWVSTSCTCLWQINREDKLFTWPPAILFRLTAGATNKNSKSAHVRFAIKILYHQQCDLKLKTMDVALMLANYPFSPSFKEGLLVPFPAASQQSDFVGAGLDTFIRRRMTCAVFGWPSIRGRKFDFLMELNVVLVKDKECRDIACSYAPGLCIGRNSDSSAFINATLNPKGVGIVCAKSVNSWPPCTGFEGAPLLCGSSVWATVTAVKPCNDTNINGSILLTRLDVQLEFLKSRMSRCSSMSILFYTFMATSILIGL